MGENAWKATCNKFSFESVINASAIYARSLPQLQPHGTFFVFSSAFDAKEIDKAEEEAKSAEKNFCG